jgi:hypothetical protein
VRGRERISSSRRRRKYKNQNKFSFSVALFIFQFFFHVFCVVFKKLVSSEFCLRYTLQIASPHHISQEIVIRMIHVLANRKTSRKYRRFEKTLEFSKDQNKINYEKT